jgi:hypothetical protein
MLEYLEYFWSIQPGLIFVSKTVADLSGELLRALRGALLEWVTGLSRK